MSTIKKRILALLLCLPVCVALLIVAVAYADDYAIEIATSRTVATAYTWTNNTGEALYISSAMFSFATSGDYTGRIQVVMGDMTNKVVDGEISSATDGSWVPSSKIWIRPNDKVLVSCLNAATDNVSKVRVQLAE